MDQEDREFQKNRSRELNSRANSIIQKANAFWMMVEAYFHRNPKSESLQNYAAHFITANRDGFLEDYDEEVIEFVWKREGLTLPNSPLMIKPGFSDWGSGGNPNYRDA